MKKFKFRFTYLYILLFIIFAFTCVYYATTDNYKTIDAIEGKVFVNNIDPNAVYYLTGDWAYFKDATLTPQSNFQDYDENFYTIKKRNNYFDGHTLTLRLVIHNSTPQPLCLLIENIHNVHDIYINKKSVISDKGSKYNDSNVIVELKTGYNEIIINLDRNEFFLFGLPEAPKIGYTSAIISNKYTFENFTMVLTIIIILFSLLFLCLFFYRRNSLRNTCTIILCSIGINLTIRYLLQFLLQTDTIFEITYTTYYKTFVISEILIVFSYFAFILFYSFEFKMFKRYFFSTIYLVLISLILIIFGSNENTYFLYEVAIFIIMTISILTMYIIYRCIGKIGRDYKNVLMISIIFLIILINSFNLINLHKFSSSMIYYAEFIIVSIIFLFKNYEHYLITSHKYTNITSYLEYEVNKRIASLVENNKNLEKEIEARREAEENLNEIIVRDYLTKLYNRLFANKKLEELTQSFYSHNHNFTLIILDIDNFKYVNDTFGHDVGDEVIKSVARNIELTTRQTDYVVRWGGEEFLIILNNSNLSAGIYVAEKIRKTVANFEISEVGKITISLGVAEMERGHSYEDVINRADEFLLKAKKSGKNCTFPKN